MATLSSDLIWEITRGTSSTLVKRKQAGGQQFSRDALNLKNSYRRKYEGMVSNKSVGIKAGEDGSVILLTKKPGKENQPSAQIQSTTFGSKKSSRKTYSAIANSTHKYRPDLLKEAVVRASAIRKTSKPVKKDQPTKLRGAKAKAAKA
ncbi:ribosomal L28e/Mak16 [Clohesyomyces aquaticus]|uniref:Ribosomal L28e/Mak16 n=1 Tax=Clohesyomyces aquaticus TaxID=1231657 RepID=A0A1Y1Y2R5_9PLEO|nr:ribosomal L28e/Mak16 [Clohesyomyces aquaticus]